MDEETIRRINREALRQAEEAVGKSSNDNNQMMYVVALVAAVVTYFASQYFKFDFVMSTKDGKKEFDMTKGVIAAVVVGLLVLLGYHLLNQ